VHDGDEVEARVFDGGISLRLKSTAARERAWDRIFSIIDEVRLRPGQSPMTDEDAAALRLYARHGSGTL
jgi:hypothetical protein